MIRQKNSVFPITWAYKTKSGGLDFFGIIFVLSLEWDFSSNIRKIVHFRTDFRQMSSKPHNFSKSGPIYSFFFYIILNKK